MRSTTFYLLMAATSPSVLSALVQPQPEEHVQAPLQLVYEGREREWDTEPDQDATGHLLFNSVSSLMQRWPNTVVRPGECAVSDVGNVK